MAQKIKEISLKEKALESGELDNSVCRKFRHTAGYGVLCMKLDNSGTCMSYNYTDDPADVADRLIRFGENIHKMIKHTNGQSIFLQKYLQTM